MTGQRGVEDLVIGDVVKECIETQDVVIEDIVIEDVARKR
jgi:hypothetical protein